MGLEEKYSAGAVALVGMFFGFLLAGSCGCGFGALLNYESQQYPDMHEEKLVVNGMPAEDFIKFLKSVDATNIVHSKGYWNGVVVSAITADFMDYVYFFEAGEFVKRMEVRRDETTPQVHPFIKMVHMNGSYGAFLVTENIEYKGGRIAQVILLGNNPPLDYALIHLGTIVKKHGGMNDPFVGGEDLADGVYLSARSDTGEIWSKAYLITFKDQSPRVEVVFRSELAKCSCFEDWMAGTDGREVFDMTVH